ncbi:hypothetical protein NEOKW01_0229 [Nematocida sp. AWRm80]|nr:hypothetical protein NEOKW01_0229 [Nematocida sp. AWRm80]
MLIEFYKENTFSADSTGNGVNSKNIYCNGSISMYKYNGRLYFIDGSRVYLNRSIIEYKKDIVIVQNVIIEIEGYNIRIIEVSDKIEEQYLEGVLDIDIEEDIDNTVDITDSNDKYTNGCYIGNIYKYQDVSILILCNSRSYNIQYLYKYNGKWEPYLEEEENRIGIGFNEYVKDLILYKNKVILKTTKSYNVYRIEIQKDNIILNREENIKLTDISTALTKCPIENTITDKDIQEYNLFVKEHPVDQINNQDTKETKETKEKKEEKSTSLKDSLLNPNTNNNQNSIRLNELDNWLEKNINKTSALNTTNISNTTSKYIISKDVSVPELSIKDSTEALKSLKVSNNLKPIAFNSTTDYKTPSIHCTNNKELSQTEQSKEEVSLGPKDTEQKNKQINKDVTTTESNIKELLDQILKRNMPKYKEDNNRLKTVLEYLNSTSKQDKDKFNKLMEENVSENILTNIYNTTAESKNILNKCISMLNTITTTTVPLSVPNTNMIYESLSQVQNTIYNIQNIDNINTTINIDSYRKYSINNINILNNRVNRLKEIGKISIIDTTNIYDTPFDTSIKRIEPIDSKHTQKEINNQIDAIGSIVKEIESNSKEDILTSMFKDEEEKEFLKILTDKVSIEDIATAEIEKEKNKERTKLMFNGNIPVYDETTAVDNRVNSLLGKSTLPSVPEPSAPSIPLRKMNTPTSTGSISLNTSTSDTPLSKTSDSILSKLSLSSPTNTPATTTSNTNTSTTSTTNIPNILSMPSMPSTLMTNSNTSVSNSTTNIPNISMTTNSTGSSLFSNSSNNRMSGLSPINLSMQTQPPQSLTGTQSLQQPLQPTQPTGTGLFGSGLNVASPLKSLFSGQNQALMPQGQTSTSNSINSNLLGQPMQQNTNSQQNNPQTEQSQNPFSSLFSKGNTSLSLLGNNSNKFAPGDQSVQLTSNKGNTSFASSIFKKPENQ